jgi:hypothetical protein
MEEWDGRVSCARRFCPSLRRLFCFHSLMLTLPALRADVVLAFILVLMDVSRIEVLS